MTLSIEGQGVSYKVQEPAKYPLTATGLTFRHFVIAGLLVGSILPIGCVVAYVLLDPRIRFTYQVEALTDVPILALVHHTTTPFGTRIFKGDIILVFSMLLLFFS